MLKYNVPGRIRAVSQCLSSSALQPITVILVWNKPFSSISFPQPSLKCSPCLHRHVNQRSFSTQANSDSRSESPHEHDFGQIIFFPILDLSFFWQFHVHVEILTVKNRKGQESVKNEKQKHDLSKSLRKDPATKSSRQVGADNPIYMRK